jgi:hypothetical protein
LSFSFGLIVATPAFPIYRAAALAYQLHISPDPRQRVNQFNWRIRRETQFVP